jgi:hypothetical protein
MTTFEANTLILQGQLDRANELINSIFDTVSALEHGHADNEEALYMIKKELEFYKTNEKEKS